MVRVFLSTALAVLSIPTAFADSSARTLTVNTGSGIDLWKLFDNLIGFLTGAAPYIAGLFFLVGVMLYSLGGVSDLGDKGKAAMKGSLIGFAIVIGAYSILRTVYFFLQG